MATDTEPKGEDAHIVYMRHSSGKAKVTRAVYVKLLEDVVLVSPFAARGAMLYSYRHEFSGFAAWVTNAQAETVAAMRGVVYVWKSYPCGFEKPYPYLRGSVFVYTHKKNILEYNPFSPNFSLSALYLFSPCLSYFSLRPGFSKPSPPSSAVAVYHSLGIRSTYMMARSYAISFVTLSFLIIISASSTIATNTKPKSEDAAHIVYMGHVSGESSKVTKAVHLKLLEDVLGSSLTARKAMLYSYTHVFSGFAAQLTEGQAKIVAGAFQNLTQVMPGVAYVLKSEKLELHTTTSWDFLGAYLKSLVRVHKLQGREDGPVPKRWRGICQSGEQFNASHCNRKRIGARFFAHGAGPAAHFYSRFQLPRDSIGHGTHTASTAGGFRCSGCEQ